MCLKTQTPLPPSSTLTQSQSNTVHRHVFLNIQAPTCHAIHTCTISYCTHSCVQTNTPHIPNHPYPHNVLLYSQVLCSTPTQFNTVHSHVFKLTGTQMPWHLQTPIHSTVHTHTILYTVMCSSLQIPRHHDIYKYTNSHTLNCPHPLNLTLYSIMCSCLQIPTANTQNTCTLNYPHPLNLPLYTVMCSCLQRPTRSDVQIHTIWHPPPTRCTMHPCPHNFQQTWRVMSVRSNPDADAVSCSQIRFSSSQ